MNDLKDRLVTYANQISGRSLIQEDYKDFLSTLRKNIEYEYKQTVPNKDLIDRLLNEYQEACIRPLGRVYQPGAPEIESTIAKYQAVIDLIAELDNNNVNEIEIKFKKLKRNNIKNKYKFIIQSQ
jgi:hypothetical protein